MIIFINSFIQLYENADYQNEPGMKMLSKL